MTYDNNSAATATTSATALPLAVGDWTLDPLHSAVNFTIRHLGIAKVRGRFAQVEAALHIGERVDDIQGERHHRTGLDRHGQRRP